MKRFAVFAYDHYYPAGGWDDLVGTYKTKEKAERKAIEAKRDCYQIVDLKTGEVVG